MPLPRKFSPGSALLGALIYGLVFFNSSAQAASSYKAVVVTPDSRASRAALKVLEAGGNAADALVTAQAVLNVVAPHSSGIFGGASLLYYDAVLRRILYFDGSVQASARAFPEMFLDSQQGQPRVDYAELRKTGLATGVPGTLKVLSEIQSRFGLRKMSFAELLEPAAAMAEEGVTVSESLAEALLAHREALQGSGDFQKVFFAGNRLLKAGETVRQEDLAKTFRLLQRKGPAVFYEGELGNAFLDGARQHQPVSGLLDKEDLKSYDLLRTDALYSNYKGYGVFTASPPSAGGVMFLAACHILEKIDLSKYAARPETVHYIGEVMKQVDPLQQWIGDPDHFDLPVVSILSKEWVEKKAANIPASKPGRYENPKHLSLPEGKKPVSVSVLIIDRHGNIANYSASLGDAFGSGRMAPGTGGFLNDLLMDFSMDPGELKSPNFPNAPGPKRRPRNFFMPVVVFKQGKPTLVLNAVNGKESVGAALNAFVQRVDFGVSCGSVLEVPRVFVRDGALTLEGDLYENDLWRVQLELFGHKIKKENFLGNGQMVCFEEDSGKMVAGSDPRGGEDGAVGA